MRLEHPVSPNHLRGLLSSMTRSLSYPSPSRGPGERIECMCISTAPSEVRPTPVGVPKFAPLLHTLQPSASAKDTLEPSSSTGRQRVPNVYAVHTHELRRLRAVVTSRRRVVRIRPCSLTWWIVLWFCGSTTLELWLRLPRRSHLGPSFEVEGEKPWVISRFIAANMLSLLQGDSF
ncbi:hypothetical protein BKA93DRAFT_771715 [Sparassis latifolia]